MEFDKVIFLENKKIRSCRSKNYKYDYNKENGNFRRWGKSLEDDPLFSPVGPEILDMEISTVCEGIGSGPCKWCYKSNTPVGKNMSFDKFKTIFHKFPRTLTQIAFGIGDIDGNPDLWKIMEYCRNNDYNYVVPNITINGYNLTDEYADKLASVCGAVAVSMYQPKDVCYDAVKKLTDRGMSQINIHKLVAHETYEECFEVLRDSKEDPRLAKLNAIVFLSLKPKGKRNTFSKLGTAKYKSLVDYALDNNVNVGFDSCSAPMFLKAAKDRENFKVLEQKSEPCESYLFSCYVNVDGKTTPCSFLEDSNYQEIDVGECDNFLKDVWNAKPIQDFRKKLLATTDKCNINGNGCRQCPEYDIY